MMVQNPWIIPDSWEWVELSEIADINPQLRFFDLPDELEVSFIPMANVEEETGNVDVSETKMYKNVRSGYTKFIDGDIIFAKITPCMENGKIAIVHDLKNSIGFGSTEFHVVRLKNKELSTKFYFYYLLQKWFRILAEQNFTGSVGHRRVPTSFIREVLVPLPPSNEQTRIVNRLEELLTRNEAGKKTLKKTQKQLKKCKQSLLKQAFTGKLTEKYRGKTTGDFDYVKGYPSNWNIKNLDEITDTTSGGTPRRSKKEYYDGNIPWLKSGELNDGYIHSTEETITKLGLKNSSTKLFPKGTLLIALYGATVGKLGILEIESSTNQAICAIFSHENINTQFLFWYMKSIRSELLRKRIGGAQPNLSQTILKKIDIPVPEIWEQKLVVEIIENKISILEKIEKEIVSSLSLSDIFKERVLKKAFEGNLISQDPCDESASVLFEKIKLKERNLRDKNFKLIPVSGDNLKKQMRLK